MPVCPSATVLLVPALEPLCQVAAVLASTSPIPTVLHDDGDDDDDAGAENIRADAD